MGIDFRNRESEPAFKLDTDLVVANLHKEYEENKDELLNDDRHLCDFMERAIDHYNEICYKFEVTLGLYGDSPEGSVEEVINKHSGPDIIRLLTMIIELKPILEKTKYTDVVEDIERTFESEGHKFLEEIIKDVIKKDDLKS